MNLSKKHIFGIAGGCVCVIAFVGGLMWYKVSTVPQETTTVEETTIEEIETTTKKEVKLPTAEEILEENRKREEKIKQAQETTTLGEIKDVSMAEAETSSSSQEETSTAPLIVPEEKPTVMTNGEDSSFISNGKKDENGNVVAVKPTEPATTAAPRPTTAPAETTVTETTTQEVPTQETELQPQTTATVPEPTTVVETTTIEETTQAQKPSTGNSSWEDMWNNAAGSGGEAIGETFGDGTPLSGEHTGY